MTTAPYVELRYNPTDLRPRDLPHVGEFLGTPAEALEAALTVTRVAMVEEMKEQVRGLSEPTHSQLLRIADLAWQARFYRFRKMSAPIIADAYLHAYQAADAGDVPMSVIYDLADKHAEKIGDYFHTSSRDALADGFNTLVNRRIPARVASDRVLDAFGLTPRQMRAYTSNTQFNNPISSRLPRSLKARARAYIDRSFTQRTRKLSLQEEHNIDEQAKQFAWMWLQDKGRLNKKAQKLWITAKDERVCSICGPLHGQKVGVNQQFKTPQGDFWSPGLHPNCRCVVRLLENRFSKADDDWDPKLHPRGYHGRFGTKTRTQTLDVDEEFERLTEGLTAPADTDPQQDLKFAEIAQYSVLPTARARVARVLPQTYAVVETEPDVETEVWTPVATPKTPIQTKTQAKLRTPAQAKLKPITVVETRTKTGTMRYAVVLGHDFDPDAPNKIQLNPGDVTYSSRKQAEAAASEAIREAVDLRVNEIVMSGHTITDYRGHRYAPSPQQVKEIVEYAARRAQIDAANTLDNPGMDITMPLRMREVDVTGEQVYNEAGNPVEMPMQMRDLVSHLSLRDSEFATPIVAIPKEYGHTPLEVHPDLDPTVFKPVTEFDGNFRTNERGWAKGQEFNALHLEARPARPKLPPRD